MLARMPMQLRTGAELRVTGPTAAAGAVVCVNGGQGGEVEGTWSASLEWLVRRLAPRLPAISPSARSDTGSSPGSGSTGASRTRGRRSTPSARRARCSSASRWAARWRSGGGRAVGGDGASGSRRGSPTGSSLEPLAAGGSSSSTERSTASCRAFPASPRRARAAASNARARSASTATYTLIPGALHGIAVRAPLGTPRPAAAGRHVGTARRGGARALSGSSG